MNNEQLVEDGVLSWRDEDANVTNELFLCWCVEQRNEMFDQSCHVVLSLVVAYCREETELLVICQVILKRKNVSVLSVF